MRSKSSSSAARWKPGCACRLGELYKEYLGVEVPNDRDGCLQDSHWSGGSFGYFPSYALGSAYGAQMLRRMEQDVDVWGRLRGATLRLSPAGCGKKSTSTAG